MFKPSAQTATWPLVHRLFREAIRPYLGRIMLALAFMAIAAACQGLTAWLMEPVVDDVFTHGDQTKLWWVAGAVLATFFTKGSAEFAQAALMNHVGLRTIADLQCRLFAHLMTLDVPFFNVTSPGSLVSRFMVDISMMRQAIASAITGIGKDTLSVIALVGVMFYQDWILALASFIVFPIAIYPISRLGKRMRKVTVNTQEQLGTLNMVLEQSFHGNRMVKSFAMEDYETAKVRTLTERIYHLTQKAAITRALSSPVMETLGGVAVAVVIIYGGYRVISHETTAGAFFSFITALMMAYRPLKALANLNTTLQEGLAGAQRLFVLLDRRAAIVEKPDAVTLENCRGDVAFDHVAFHYVPETPALENVSIAIPQGKTVALVGPSGAGKTTILNLIPRFFDVTGGAVRIDGHDVRDLSFASLRAAIAFVSQDIVLFDDTVRANIAFGRPGASEREIEDAARHAGAFDFIQALPEGFETPVGQRGMNLSGGQRQRIAIARAILKDAPILLLDEATSALDTESERHVQGALEHLMKNRTTVVIAHRLSTIVNADIIYVINDGTIVEQGSHRELLAKGRYYAGVYHQQFSRQGESDAMAAPITPPIAPTS
ncbi:ABC transporter ATP-binding protein [Varunaivibrio sulfuroxidans]|uniref:Subfamily B ATP-binding cassette protein MsbA n=1 Tax=Varunaivibrio sulfuroxidans TaxID=1773489 RepID=A0A4R3JHJ4_9PROT|nr:ABC transporter transmembrane domain-containing protein [Varunaivibrio sulfuroxidans]TCS64985.1 subfamily B ATP-binding cassette protein MsbA [Varunaivibrio sulfuroxidans]WES29725.1 ABC transporter transmembrane domain-containing protein [Varunaivibrio sulfuroxidans]